MKLILMRHADRRHDMQELVAELTPEGKAGALEVKVGLEEKNLSPKAVFSSEQNPARATAALVFPGSTLVETRILNPGPDANSLTWATLSGEVSRQLRGKFNEDVTEGDVIAVVGHHPFVTKVLCSVTGRPLCRRIGFGEAVVITGPIQKMKEGRATVETVFGTKDASELLRKKIELKMTVCTFLAGFTVAVLVEFLKEPLLEMLEGWRIVPTLAFLSSLAWFVGGILAFDRLLMPSEFWGVIGDKMKPSETDDSDFAFDYRLNGVLYANMVRIWMRFFIGGSIFTLVGLLALLFKGVGIPEVNLATRAGILWGGGVVSIVVGGLAYAAWKPRLGIED